MIPRDRRGGDETGEIFAAENRPGLVRLRPPAALGIAGDLDLAPQAKAAGEGLRRAGAPTAGPAPCCEEVTPSRADQV